MSGNMNDDQGTIDLPLVPASKSGPSENALMSPQLLRGLKQAIQQGNGISLTQNVTNINNNTYTFSSSGSPMGLKIAKELLDTLSQNITEVDDILRKCNKAIIDVNAAQKGETQKTADFSKTKEEIEFRKEKLQDSMHNHMVFFNFMGGRKKDIDGVEAKAFSDSLDLSKTLKLEIEKLVMDIENMSLKMAANKAREDKERAEKKLQANQDSLGTLKAKFKNVKHPRQEHVELINRISSRKAAVPSNPDGKVVFIHAHFRSLPRKRVHEIEDEAEAVVEADANAHSDKKLKVNNRDASEELFVSPGSF